MCSGGQEFCKICESILNIGKKYCIVSDLFSKKVDHGPYSENMSETQLWSSHRMIQKVVTYWCKRQTVLSEKVFIYLSSVLGFEFRGSCLLDRCFTTWATSPSLFAYVIFGVGYCGFAWASLHFDTSIYASHTAGITGVHHCAQFLLVEMESH
jgi:hypothetical protein